jgi:hypothetical protein
VLEARVSKSFLDVGQRRAGLGTGSGDAERDSAMAVGVTHECRDHATDRRIFANDHGVLVELQVLLDVDQTRWAMLLTPIVAAL